MIVSELTDQDRPAWDAYVTGSPHGLPFHLSGWKDVLFRTYRYETPYLLAREGDRIVGVMPLLVIRSFLVGNAVTTLPGGLCADNEDAARLMPRVLRRYRAMTRLRMIKWSFRARTGS